MEEAEKQTHHMIHGGVIQEQNGQFHVWYVNLTSVEAAVASHVAGQVEAVNELAGLVAQVD